MAHEFLDSSTAQTGTCQNDMKKKPRKCLWCNERDVIPDEHDLYNTCQPCLDERGKNKVSVAVYKLPGNP